MNTTPIKLPLLRFQCNVAYTTTTGKTHTKAVRVYAQAADLAAEMAERHIREDKRRKVATAFCTDARNA